MFLEWEVHVSVAPVDFDHPHSWTPGVDGFDGVGDVGHPGGMLGYLDARVHGGGDCARVHIHLVLLEVWVGHVNTYSASS